MNAPYAVHTVGADWCEVDDTTDCRDKAAAWADARRRVALWPQYCTVVFACGEDCLDILWTSRPDPDDDPTIPEPPWYHDRCRDGF